MVGSEDSDKEGIVEICFGTLWGIISDNTWSDENAKVVCSQLSFTPARECFCTYNSPYLKRSCEHLLHVITQANPSLLVKNRVTSLHFSSCQHPYRMNYKEAKLCITL